MTKNILIIDNYDSFTQNLHHLLKMSRPQYSFTVLRNRDRSMFDSHFHGLVISPGPYGPEETGLLKELFEKRVLPKQIPILGVCLGMQFLAHYYGLSIGESEDARHGRQVLIESENRDIFKNVESPFKVVRYNSLSILESKKEIEMKSELKVTAWQSDSSMIMGLCHRSLPFSGVQFHPESFLTENSKLLIDNFFKAHIDD